MTTHDYGGSDGTQTRDLLRDRQAFVTRKQSKRGGDIRFELLSAVVHLLQIHRLSRRQCVGFFGGDTVLMVLIVDHRSALTFKSVKVIETIGVPGGI